MPSSGGLPTLEIIYRVKTGLSLPYTLDLVGDRYKRLTLTNATGTLNIPNFTAIDNYWSCLVNLRGTGNLLFQRPDGTQVGLFFSGGNTRNRLKTQGTVAITHLINNEVVIEGALES